MPKRTPGKTHEVEEPFECDRVCRDMRGTGEFIEEQRAARGCTRFDLPRVEWDIAPGRLRRGYMGRPPVPGVTEEDGHKVNPQRPLERVSDGCPGGWYRSRFVWSLGRYLRVRVEGGQRVPNPLLDRCEDEFVILCERIYVQEQERAVGYRLESMK